MSSCHRNAEKRREREAQCIIEEQERLRLEARSMWEKVEDCETITDVKTVLHEIVSKLGL